jgi:hypothetical protein
MNQHLSAALAHARAADLRHEAQDKSARACGPAVAHERQRALVRASLLLSRREPETRRRASAAG